MQYQFYITIKLLILIQFVGCGLLQHGVPDDIVVPGFFSRNTENPDVIVFDLSNVDHANGAEIPRNLTEEDTKIIPTNIDFAALKESYAKENKGERFLPSRLVFDDEEAKKKR